MRKLVFTGGLTFEDGRTHPITVFRPNKDDQSDGRPHAYVDEDWGFLRIAEDPANFQWGEVKPGDDARHEEAAARWSEIVAEREAAKGGAALAVVPAQPTRLVRELAEAQSQVGQLTTALATQGEALTQAMTTLAEINKRLASLEAKGKKGKAKAEEAKPDEGDAGDDQGDEA